MEDEIVRRLIIKCKIDANKHGWVVSWERKLPFLTVGEALDLIHTELSEATEAYRDNNKDKFGIELADAIIRIFHLAGDLDIPLGKILLEKMKINKSRPYKHGRKIY